MATLRVPSFGIVETFDDATALAKAQRIREMHPTIDVLVDISSAEPSSGSPPRPAGLPDGPDGADQLDIPEFLREAAEKRARR